MTEGILGQPSPPVSIGSGGGIAASVGDEAIFDLPQGSVQRSWKFQVRLIKAPNRVGQSRGLQGVALTVTDAPESGVAFRRPATLRVAYDRSAIRSSRESELMLAWWDPEDKEWVPLRTNRDPWKLNVSAQVPGTGIYALLSQAPEPAPKVTWSRAWKGDKVGVRRAPGDASILITVTVSVDRTAYGATLAELLPSGWTVTDKSGATLEAGARSAQRLAWSPGKLRPGSPVSLTYRVKTPASTYPPATYSLKSEADHALRQEEGNAWEVVVASPVVVTEGALSLGESWEPSPGAAFGLPPTAIRRHQPFIARSRVMNPDVAAVSFMPSLQWREDGSGKLLAVPGGYQEPAPAFYIRQGARGFDDRRGPGAATQGRDGPSGPQRIYTQSTYGTAMEVAAKGSAEVRFLVWATAEAEHDGQYFFRLTDKGDRLDAFGEITARMAEREPVALTQPQFDGRKVADSLAGVQGPATGDDANADLTTATATMASLASDDMSILAASFASPHANYSATPDQCASCHRSHTAKSRSLLAQPAPQSALCFTCHDGTGANSDAKSQFMDPAVPANDPTTSSFYSHPATQVSGHTLALAEEFKGVSNRHSECADCHNPHAATAGFAIASSTGWNPSGALQGATGVAVTNGGAGTIPTYSFADPVSKEYQVCFKCHTSYTVLLSYSKESYKKWDKGQEFNPNNGSFHPVEAPGTNSTTGMANNLAGSSPYKLWTFSPGDVVRCANCHGDYRLANPASPPLASARLAPHASKYQGTLMNNYRSRDLKPTSNSNNYSAADFALCFQCHSEGPYRDTSGDRRGDTNFRFHGFHLNKLYDDPGDGLVGDIDTPGTGQGNAICAECHYQIHGNPSRGNTSGRRLVEFAPNVVAGSKGGPSWASSEQGAGSCTLRCHGQDHNPRNY